MSESTVQTLGTISILRFLQPNDAQMPNNSVAVRIERDSDGLVYDAGAALSINRVFKNDATCERPFIFLVQGTDNNKGRLEAQITIDTNFLDGDYIINYHDMRQPGSIFAMDRVKIYKGTAVSVKPLLDIDIALRIMQIQIDKHKSANTLGALINDLYIKMTDVQTRVKAIQTKLGI